jgi:putative MATE family efflux protein
VEQVRAMGYRYECRMSPPAKRSQFDRRIIDGSLLGAVWHLAWPTVLQNMIGGLQGVVDHAMVGHFVGYTGNAAIGVSWQIFLVVIVFISSLYSGMAVMVSRFAGAGEADKVNRVVYQAFLASILLSVCILPPVGYFAAPYLLDLVNAAPQVKREALLYLRIMFLFSAGLMMFFMLGGALRSAGDARTTLKLGIVLTVLNLVFNYLFITGAGPFPALGTAGSAVGTCLASAVVAAMGVWLLFSGRLAVQFKRRMRWRPDFRVLRSLAAFGLPTGFQGIAMNIGGVLLLRYIGSLEHSAEAQAAYAVGYNQLFSFVTWTSVGLMSATAVVVGQNLGADRVDRARAAVGAGTRLGLSLAITVGLLFLFVPERLLGLFGMNEPTVIRIGEELLRYLALSGLFVTVALVFTGGLQGSGDTRSPFFISLVSQVLVPLGLCAFWDARGGLEAVEIWTAIVVGHLTRCVLSVVRFRQGKWRRIVVDIPTQDVTTGTELGVER